jgi:hypothetical protein
LLGLAIAFSGLAMVLLAGPARAAGPVRSEIEPLDLTVDAAEVTPRPDRVRAAWRARGSTTLACPEGEAVIALDVREHALVGSQQDDILIHGQVRILIDFTGAGVRELDGRLRGTAACDASGDCQVVAEVRAHGHGGVRLRIEQSLPLDLAGPSISDLEVRRGVLIP